VYILALINPEGIPVHAVELTGFPSCITVRYLQIH